MNFGILTQANKSDQMLADLAPGIDKTMRPIPPTRGQFDRYVAKVVRNVALANGMPAHMIHCAADYEGLMVAIRLPGGA